MLYQKIAEVYSKLEATSSTLEKTKILAGLFKNCPENLIKTVVRLATGEIFAPWEQKELNLGEKLTIAAIARATGARKEEIEKLRTIKGDLGAAAAYLVAMRKQRSLFVQDLTVEEVYNTLRRIGEAEGEGSMDLKISLLSKLLSNAKPEEAKYLVRTVLGQLRIGVGEGIVRDALARAFAVPTELVERAYAIINDFGEVAEILVKEGKEGLKKVKFKPGRPLKVMLYHKAESAEDAIKKVGLPCRVEFKYDGFRTQIHKMGDKIFLFTRRLEDVTKQFPDVVERVKKFVKAEVAILDSETVGVDKATGRWLPFQRISQRIKRKYDIEKMIEEIPVETHVFDILYLNGENLIDLPLEERLKKLEEVIESSEAFKVADGIIANSVEEIEEFYHEALRRGAEGIMIKNLKAPYVPGQRTGYGYKLKPVMETLDLVIIGAEWGEGKRAHWLSSYLLAARDEATGEFLPVGKLGTGMTEEELERMTEMLKPLIEEEKGKEVKIRPKIVVEVAFQEIQKSPKYASGFALRFPRLVRIREDRSPEECDTVARVAELYRKQREGHGP